jgi:hypothetical protein
MPRIFVSYRRADSAQIVGRLHDKLTARYGSRNVLVDIDSIPPARDFRESIEMLLRGCDAVLAIVGHQWCGPGGGGASRILETDDFVRNELESALRLNLPIIPVLVDGATMPAPAALPETLQAMPYLNAVLVETGKDFHHQLRRLMRAIDAVTAPAWIAAFPLWVQRGWGLARRRGWVAAIALIIVLSSIYLILGFRTGDSEATLALSAKLRQDYRNALVPLESGVVDFRRAKADVVLLQRLDKDDGLVSYYSGEIKRLSNPSLFTAGSCPKPWSFSPALDLYHWDFYRYLDGAATRPAAEMTDPGLEVCYHNPKGYCLQDTAWIYHLLANDFYQAALVEPNAIVRKEQYRKAYDFAVKATMYHAPEGGEGFSQCVGTTALIKILNEKLGRAG